MGIDETGCKVDSKKYWHWTFQDSNTTLIIANQSRGAKVINETLKDGFVDACVVKVKLKVSGQFKSKQGAIDYANLRSIVDTARKRGMDEFDALHRMVNGEALF